jgi:pyrimidine operon attenuation protein/uracil phosphoribosyltransferase
LDLFINSAQVNKITLQNNKPCNAGLFILCKSFNKLVKAESLFLLKFPVLKSIITAEQISITLKRLAHQVLENHVHLSNTVLIGLQPRGIYLSDRIVKEVRAVNDLIKVEYGKLDITFYRDDVRKELHVPNQTDISFSIEDKNVVLIDDVLYTGRTIRAALDALMDFGRPSKVELMVLIDRRYSRQLPIQPDYTGKSIDSIITQKVKVLWQEKDGKDEVVLI